MVKAVKLVGWPHVLSRATSLWYFFTVYRFAIKVAVQVAMAFFDEGAFAKAKRFAVRCAGQD